MQNKVTTSDEEAEWWDEADEPRGELFNKMKMHLYNQMII